MTNPLGTNSIRRSFLRRRFLFIALTFACYGPWPKGQAVSPPPDGSYPGANTAEGNAALFSLTTGGNNTALGSQALYSVTSGNQNTATGAQALKNNTGDENTADGFQALVNNTGGTKNAATGWRALFQNKDGAENVAVGAGALYTNISGGGNTAVGISALYHNTGGIFNTAIGGAALSSNSGSGNIAIGVFAGQDLTTGNSNIDIANAGNAGESNTIRIGTSQTATYIAGINGVSETGPVSIVTINGAGQLGTTPPISSSKRFKKEIKTMDKASAAILALKPVTFKYKNDAKAVTQFGLVAEEVAEVNPDLVVRDNKGEIYTVRYDAVNAMLLNEFLKEHRKVEELQATIVRQQKDFAARLKEQDAKIQSVSDRVELNKPAPQLATSSQ